MNRVARERSVTLLTEAGYILGHSCILRHTHSNKTLYPPAIHPNILHEENAVCDIRQPVHHHGLERVCNRQFGVSVLAIFIY